MMTTPVPFLGNSLAKFARLICQDGFSNKEYIVCLIVNGTGTHDLVAFYGPLGAATKQAPKLKEAPLSLAEKEFDSLVRSKKRKGYVEVDDSGNPLGTAAATRTRPNILYTPAMEREAGKSLGTFVKSLFYTAVARPAGKQFWVNPQNFQVGKYAVDGDKLPMVVEIPKAEVPGCGQLLDIIKQAFFSNGNPVEKDILLLQLVWNGSGINILDFIPQEDSRYSFAMFDERRRFLEVRMKMIERAVPGGVPGLALAEAASTSMDKDLLVDRCRTNGQDVLFMDSGEDGNETVFVVKPEAGKVAAKPRRLLVCQGAGDN